MDIVSAAIMSGIAIILVILGALIVLGILAVTHYIGEKYGHPDAGISAGFLLIIWLSLTWFLAS